MANDKTNDEKPGGPWSAREARAQLDRIQCELAAQDARLLEACAQLDPRQTIAIPPGEQECFEALCGPPERRDGRTTGPATIYGRDAIRC